MILAAGRGERMRPLTDATPKPLLAVRGKPLMQWPLDALAAGGFADLVVNTAWLGEQISDRFAARSISWSHEGRDFGGALETAGGIVRALPVLGDVFWVAAGDVFAPDFVFTQHAVDRFVASDKLAHLWLVPNPAHNPKGDFGLSPQGLARNQNDGERFTFSTIGLYRAALFAPPYCALPTGNPFGAKAPLAPILRAAMDNELVSAERYTGAWTDVGTPERLQQLNTP
ncbi:nucleotidyltransferase family protein [Variovorax sp. PAMC 28711]|uniref:nucleotidyltransferase family protein n=1 Tax=Variovorax sp. PAMC 28711 TaxID=1795631 RepID=UPI00078ECF3D|nr:nucleotidyltransferase family protein [Variovorax sp. PAMC 28711]AMM26730.1 nucleotidyltransferase [Variovorax sp. PAMC 28711]